MQFVSVADVIKFAIQQEEAAAHYYESAAATVKDTEIKKIFQALAVEEVKHKKRLADFELGKNPSLDSMTCMINHYTEGPANSEFKLSFNKKEILDYVINTEKESEYFYISMAEATKNDEDLRKLFSILATIENQHIVKLTALYNHPFFKS